MSAQCEYLVTVTGKYGVKLDRCEHPAISGDVFCEAHSFRMGVFERLRSNGLPPTVYSTLALAERALDLRRQMDADKRDHATLDPLTVRREESRALEAVRTLLMSLESSEPDEGEVKP